MALIVTLILAAHFAFLAYVVLGGFVAWRWPRAFWPHVAAAAWGVAVVAIPLTCPLTTAEAWARERAGMEPMGTGFVDRYIEGVLYPERFTQELRLLVAAAVLVSWAGVYARWRSARRARVGATRPDAS